MLVVSFDSLLPYPSLWVSVFFFITNSLDLCSFFAPNCFFRKITSRPFFPCKWTWFFSWHVSSHVTFFIGWYALIHVTLFIFMLIHAIRNRYSEKISISYN